MRIVRNITGLPAELFVATDKDGRDHWVLVLKGALRVGSASAPEPAEFVYADVHHGEPGSTGIRFECDFVLRKPHADVLIDGRAYAPREVTELEVALEVEGRRKTVRVVGDRRWEAGPKPSPPAPFRAMPLTFDRAFGGTDPKGKADLRNPVGRGFLVSADAVVGAPLPNLERPDAPLAKWSDAPPPVGFGVVGRNWLPRSEYAGTYDQAWIDGRAPFLPGNFDDRYFQSAPEDQWFPYFRGGETLRCFNMSPEEPEWEARVPELKLSAAFLFADGEILKDPDLDTVLLQPDRRRMVLTWRASVPAGRKLQALRGVMLGRDGGWK